MTLRNTADSYGMLAKGLHWIMALLIFALLGLGLYMTSLPDGDPKWVWYDLHKSIGVTVFALLLVRVAWRRLSPPPALPATLKPHEHVLAHGGHALIYVAVFVLPVTGYLDSAWGGFHISFFNWFDIPLAFGKDKAKFEITVAVHRWTAYGLIALLVAHVGAALKHHFIDGDNVLRRMGFDASRQS